MKTRLLWFLAVGTSAVGFVALDGCTGDDDTKGPTLAVDASGLDVATSETSTKDGSGSTDAGPSDTGTSDAGPNDAASTDAGDGAVPSDAAAPHFCQAAFDAGDSGACKWVAVDFCGGSTNFKVACGAVGNPNRGLTCASTVNPDLPTSGGPDGSYYNYNVQGCGSAGCSNDPQHTTWQCIECCP